MPIFRRWMDQLKQVGAVASGTGSWGNYSGTIASDALTIGDPGIYAVTGEGGLADELATISGGNTGDEIVLYAANTATTITVKHGTGNIHVGADFALDDEYDMIRLIKRSNGKWTGGGLADNA